MLSEQTLKLGLSEAIESEMGMPKLYSNIGIYNIKYFSYRDKTISYSLTKQEKKKLLSFTKLMAIHLFMVVNPLPGMEYTVKKNKDDIINKWMKPTLKVCNRESKTLNHIFVDDEPYHSEVRTELIKKHGYKKVVCDLEYIYLLLDQLQANFNRYCISKMSYSDDDLRESLDKTIEYIKSDKLQKTVSIC